MSKSEFAHLCGAWCPVPDNEDSRDPSSLNGDSFMGNLVSDGRGSGYCKYIASSFCKWPICSWAHSEQVQCDSSAGMKMDVLWHQILKLLKCDYLKRQCYVRSITTLASLEGWVDSIPIHNSGFLFFLLLIARALKKLIDVSGLQDSRHWLM